MNSASMIRYFVAAALLTLSSAALAAPMLEKQDLFEAGAEGYYTYRIPGLLVTQRGAVLATAEARRGKAATGTTAMSCCAAVSMAAEHGTSSGWWPTARHMARGRSATLF